MMLVLESTEDGKKVEEILAQSVPESLTVYGSVFHINRGNPLNMEVLVDSWPDFKTVICKPRPEEMVDDTNIYTNLYFIFTTDPENLRAMLRTSNVINWNQCLQIEGLQQYLDPVIMSIAESKGLEVERDKALLFVRDIHLGVSEESPHVTMMEKAAAQTSSHLKGRDKQPAFPCSPVSAADAELVNAAWVKGGTEASLRFVHRCISKLPSLCIRDSEGKPISWYVMDQKAELRMAYTVPYYRCQGFSSSLLSSFMVSLCIQQDDFPFYYITSEHNVQAQSVAKKVGLQNSPCGYIQWICRPRQKQLTCQGGLLQKERPCLASAYVSAEFDAMLMTLSPRPRSTKM
ncbi:glycine N-acyltransferase-like [Pleurodeles waltl]|uniref:glycine N-acyltransferase-like n=1 Tax=Pleurodeles waltl TaxID=8319 RepID=UPI003709A44B